MPSAMTGMISFQDALDFSAALIYATLITHDSWLDVTGKISLHIYAAPLAARVSMNSARFARPAIAHFGASRAPRRLLIFT